MKGPRAQTSFLDSARPTKPMVSTNRIRSAIGTEIYLRDLTQASDDQRYEIPCPLLDELKDVQNRCESKENNKDDCSDLRWVVSVQDVGVGVVKCRTRFVIGHNGCASSRPNIIRDRACA